MLNAALAGFGLVYVPEDLARRMWLKDVSSECLRMVPAFSGIPPLLPEPPSLLTGIRLAG